jgi:hypothetical protein
VKKRESVLPAVQGNSLQAIIDFLVDNGMSEFDIDRFIHLNLPALGGYTNIMDCVREDRWEDAWRVSKQYIDGDYF